MKKLLLFVIILGIGLLTAEIHKKPQAVNAKKAHRFIVDEPEVSQIDDSNSQPIAVHNSRDFSFSSVLIDSSKNGYGMYSNTTNPLVWVPGTGFLAVYRQWAGIDGTSGQLGAAQSSDGVTWEVGVALNSLYPGGAEPDDGGTPKARYPSAVGSAGSYPTPVWNEYTGGSGGGTNNGRAMYTYDEFGWLGGSYVSPVYDLNTGCATLPCDPPDLWVGQAQMVDNQFTGSPTFLAIYGEGLGPDNHWLLRNDYYLFGYLGMAAPVLILDEINDGFTSGYTGTPEFHINDAGVGYLVTSSYWNDYNSGGSINHHTFFYKKTEDYGATWTETGGYMGSAYTAMPDSVLDQLMTDAGFLGDSLYEITGNGDTLWTVVSEAFTAYDYDVKVDDAGGLHILANVVAVASDSSVWVSIPGCGQYHFYNPTPEDQTTWTASLVRDMEVSWNGTYTYGEFSGWQYIYPDMAMSPDGSVIWAVTSAVSDTAGGTYTDLDIFLAKSTDGGATFVDLGNVTNTPSTITTQNYDMSPHFAPYASESDAYFLFQMADFGVNTVGGTNFEDYKQRVYVGHAYDPVVGVGEEATVPTAFTLSQNYPNPFNPVTRVAYSIATAGDVSIDLYDARGSHVKSLVNEYRLAGKHEFMIDGKDLASGVYFYTMIFADHSLTKKLVLMK